MILQNLLWALPVQTAEREMRLLLQAVATQKKLKTPEIPEHWDVARF